MIYSFMNQYPKDGDVFVHGSIYFLDVNLFLHLDVDMPAEHLPVKATREQITEGGRITIHPAGAAHHLSMTSPVTPG